MSAAARPITPPGRRNITPPITFTCFRCHKTYKRSAEGRHVIVVEHLAEWVCTPCVYKDAEKEGEKA